MAAREDALRAKLRLKRGLIARVSDRHRARRKSVNAARPARARAVRP
jgi:hypothetical protein